MTACLNFLCSLSRITSENPLSRPTHVDCPPFHWPMLWTKSPRTTIGPFTANRRHCPGTVKVSSFSFKSSLMVKQCLKLFLIDLINVKADNHNCNILLRISKMTSIPTVSFIFIFLCSGSLSLALTFLSLQTVGKTTFSCVCFVIIFQRIKIMNLLMSRFLIFY